MGDTSTAQWSVSRFCSDPSALSSAISGLPSYSSVSPPVGDRQEDQRPPRLRPRSDDSRSRATRERDRKQIWVVTAKRGQHQPATVRCPRRREIDRVFSLVMRRTPSPVSALVT